MSAMTPSATSTRLRYPDDRTRASRGSRHDRLLAHPQADAKPRTAEGDQMRHFKVQAWISESDHELVKLDAEAIDTLRIGLGVLARLHKGARLSFLRRRSTARSGSPRSSATTPAHGWVCSSRSGAAGRRSFPAIGSIGSIPRGFPQAEVANRAFIVPIVSVESRGKSQAQDGQRIGSLFIAP